MSLSAILNQSILSKGGNIKKHCGRKIQFNEIINVKVMFVWEFAHREARKSKWMEIRVDDYRFKRRIQSIINILNPILDGAHRQKIFNKNYNHYYENDIHMEMMITTIQNPFTTDIEPMQRNSVMVMVINETGQDYNNNHSGTEKEIENKKLG